MKFISPTDCTMRHVRVLQYSTIAPTGGECEKKVEKQKTNALQHRDAMAHGTQGAIRQEYVGVDPGRGARIGKIPNGSPWFCRWD